MDQLNPDRSDLYEQFLKLFTRDQFRVLGYIRALIYDHSAANDVFQETSLLLWKSFSSYRPEAEFAPWALGIARHQVLKYWRTRDRDRHIFSESLLRDLAEEAMPLADELDSRQRALDECVDQLPERQQDLLHRFYGQNQSAGQIAQAWDRSVNTIYKALKVMRRSLRECVEGKLSGDMM